ncbi:hypothetical protein DY000_02015302 [Brassica cretica]|uniref:Uncharacterized protein n=1 Tax=Brassica cretica TaxID=69181 RepID=A0ABQ7D0W3_BRACR|nr:hypothetical protein DY000_02015302 [Brassica cretica]
MSPLRMKSLGECSQLNYGAPRRRTRLNGVQMWELCNLHIRRPSVFANLGHMDRPAHILILTANEPLGSDEPGLPEVPFAFSDHIQHPAKVILPDLGRITWSKNLGIGRKGVCGIRLFAGCACRSDRGPLRLFISLFT